MHYKRIEVHEENSIAIISLNRPDKLNAFDMQMFIDLDVLSRQLKKRLDLRAIIIQGNGRAFSVGLDITMMKSNHSNMLKLLWKILPRKANLAQRVVHNWRKIPIPVFTVIHGDCFGAGMQLALGADFRIASPKAFFSIMEAKWGLFPDMAGFINLRTILPKDQAMWLTMGAGVFDVNKAKELGLITRISENPLECAIEMANKLTKVSPDSLAATKYMMNKYWHAGNGTILSKETRYQIKILFGKNFKVAVRRQFSKSNIPYLLRKFK